jgi:MFS family permease
VDQHGPVADDNVTAAGSPLGIASFRRVWAGATVSAAGDAAGWVALVALVLARPQGNVAVLAALYTAPVAAGGLLAGWALDRYDRRRLLMGDSLVRAAVFATVPVAAVLGKLDVTQLYLVAAVYGLFKMISLAGFPALIPSLVPAGQLTAANALESVSFGIAGLAGAVAAGVAVATVGPGDVVSVDAVSYLVFALCLAGTRDLAGTRPVRDRAAGQDSGGLGPVLKLVAREPVLRDTTVMFALFNVGEGVLLVLLPRCAAGYGLGAGGYGYLVAAMTTGELLGALALLRRPWRAPLTWSIVAASLVAAMAVLALLAPSPWAAMAGLAGLGGCAAAMTAWAQTLRMVRAPAAAHGRLFGLLRTLMQAAPPLGAGLAVLTLRHGVPVTVAVVCALMAVPALAFARDLTAAGARVAGQDVARSASRA